jgi:MraZ protein
MTGFFGSYELNVDGKGRFQLPSSFRKQMPDNSSGRFVMTRGMEKCLSLYPEENWRVLEKRVRSLNEFNPKVRLFKRLFFGGITLMEPDTAGRLLIPKQLLEYAGIEKEMIFFAQGDKIEIWDKETYNKLFEEESGNISALAEEVLGSNFFNAPENEI